MKSLQLLKKMTYLLMAIAVIGVTTNTTLAQSKKKLVRIIEIDDKGEHVVKEINLSGDKHIIFEDIDNARIDSITKSMQFKIESERNKMDSLCYAIKIIAPNRIPIPLMPDFDMDEAMWITPDFPHDFDIFLSDSVVNGMKMYYNEKGFGKNDDLSKMLEDLENDTFDPNKWNMKEIEKDKIKDFKTSGKGDVIIFGDNSSKRNHFYGFSRHSDKLKKEFEKQRKAFQMAYVISDSLDGDKEKEYTIQSTISSDGDNQNKVIIMSPNSKKGKRVFINKDGDNEKTVKVFVTVNDNGKTKIELTNPSNDDYKTLQNAGLAKEDKTKQLSPESLTFISAKDKDKYTIGFNGDEKGKVKITIVDKEGKTIFTDEFDNSKGSTEKEVEIKGLKSGDYFIQAQQNGKAITMKMEIEIEK